MQPLDGGQRDPQIVGVEDLELGNRLKFVNVGLRDLCDLQQPQMILILDQSTTLDRRETGCTSRATLSSAWIRSP